MVDCQLSLSTDDVLNTSDIQTGVIFKFLLLVSGLHKID